jgi:HD-GYP domain-containing protein (c-di-GMP phosphodiesterase class II)
LQIADIYDALTNSRCYKPANAPKEAIRIIEEETARGWRDPEVVTQFLRIHKDVLTPVVEYTRRRDCSLMALENALLNLTPLMKPAGYYYPARLSFGPAA